MKKHFKEAPLIMTWITVFLLGMLLCFLIDGFVLHDITLDGERPREDLAQVVYPGCRVDRDCTVFAGNPVLYIRSGSENRLLFFHQSYITHRWRLVSDQTVPDDYTGTVTTGGRFIKGPVVFTGGVPDRYAGENMLLNMQLSFYLLIAAGAATAALVPAGILVRLTKRKQ